MKNKVSLFLYGTLQDLDVLKLVTLRQEISSCDLSDATLYNFCLETVKDQSYPLIVSKQQSSIKGKIFEVITNTELERLRYFEDDQEYTLKKFILETKSGEKECHLFFPTSKVESSKKSWSYENWSQVTNKEAFLERVKNYMDQFNSEHDSIW